MGATADKRFQKARQPRRSKGLKAREEAWLFFCEGSKTEPNYIKSLVEYANSKTSKAKLKIHVEGDGRNTKSLIRSVEDFFERVDNLYKDKHIKYIETFVLFDKDSFSSNDFNTAIDMAISREYIPIWSNECFELWFLLHFNNHISDNGREAYYSKLKTIMGKSYKKADDMFPIIHSAQGIKNAVMYSKMLNKNFEDEPSCAKKVPCTQMFRFIEMLEKHLSIDLKNE
jgi:hypothetical protein